MTDTDPRIRHVVLLIMENHSFDQMLGCFKQIYPDLDGVDPANLRENSDNDNKGGVFKQAPTTERQMALDPHHEVNHVAIQLADHNAGFVKDFAAMFPDSTPDERRFIMGYYPLDFLPALHALAREFTICDHWFSSLPGPTWPNRFMALSGTSLGHVDMPFDGEHEVDPRGWFEQTQPTIFDRLNDKNIRWKNYFHDIPQTAVFSNQRQPHNAAHYYYIRQFFSDARGREEEFPQFSLIEPRFNGADENDDHPPHDIMKAEKLIADVYNAIRANEQLWESTLLIIFYDEHGGFYDHVVPPAAVPPDDASKNSQEYKFNQLGLRVPALLVSPWVDKRVEPQVFDHTSVLKYLIEKWGLDPLGDRAASAANIRDALVCGSPRKDTPLRIELTADQLAAPRPELEEKAEDWVSAHHRALQAIVDYVKLDVVEGLPIIYTAFARGIEACKSFLEFLLAWVYRERSLPPVSMTEPDRLSREKGTLRDQCAVFIKHQKQKVVPILASKIRDTHLPLEQREMAAHTLSLVAGRGFHRKPDKIDEAMRWLDRHGH